MGPTGVGKTATAVDLVGQFPLDIVSVDAAQVYKGMDIGTAKPSSEELKRAPHRMIDICSPWERYSAGRFCDDALKEIRQIIDRGRIPLLVGGTMFYFKALESGLSALPQASGEIRLKLDRRLVSEGIQSLYAQLVEIDPVCAARISPGDVQRILRLLELYLIKGAPPSELMSENQAIPIPFEILKIAVFADDRSELRARISDRFQKMLQAGLVAEAQLLYRNPRFDRNLPAMRSVGYRQAWQYFDGDLSLDEMTQNAVQATCAIAKRQLTWMRNAADVTWVLSDAKSSVDKIGRVLQSRLSR